VGGKIAKGGVCPWISSTFTFIDIDCKWGGDGGLWVVGKCGFLGDEK
jgi:hypothetical protein